MDQTQSPQLRQHLIELQQWRRRRALNYAARKNMDMASLLDLIIGLANSDVVNKEIDSVVEDRFHSSRKPAYRQDLVAQKDL